MTNQTVLNDINKNDDSGVNKHSPGNIYALAAPPVALIFSEGIFILWERINTQILMDYSLTHFISNEFHRKLNQLLSEAKNR